MPLGRGEREGSRSPGDGSDVLALLLRRAGTLQHAAAEDDGGEIGLEHEILAEALGQQHGLDRAATETAVLFRERQAEDAEFGELGPDVRAPATRQGGDLLAALEVIGVGEEALHRVLEELLFFGQVEIHRESLLVTLSVGDAGMKTPAACPSTSKGRPRGVTAPARPWR